MVPPAFVHCRQLSGPSPREPLGQAPSATQRCPTAVVPGGHALRHWPSDAKPPSPKQKPSPTHWPAADTRSPGQLSAHCKPACPDAVSTCPGGQPPGWTQPFPNGTCPSGQLSSTVWMVGPGGGDSPSSEGGGGGAPGGIGAPPGGGVKSGGASSPSGSGPASSSPGVSLAPWHCGSCGFCSQMLPTPPASSGGSGSPG